MLAVAFAAFAAAAAVIVVAALVAAVVVGIAAAGARSKHSVEGQEPSASSLGHLHASLEEEDRV